MPNPSDILFSIIREKVYKEGAIREVSLNSLGKQTDYIFDFKSQSIARPFLEEYAQVFWESFPEYHETLIQVGGMETGAIPFITGVSIFSPERSRCEGFYIRKSRKKRDLANLVEGELVSDAPIILIDDILNSGSTMRKQIHILEGLGCTVSAIFVCLRYRDETAYQDIIKRGIRIVSIFELNDFKHVLPVENRSNESALMLSRMYEVEYMVTLTKKPNMYLVTSKPDPVLVDEYLYISSDDGVVHCFQSSNGKVVWTYRVPFGFRGKYILSSLVVYEHVVLFGAYDGNVYCLNRLTGKIRWIFMDADWVGSSPCIDRKRGRVYLSLGFGLFGKQGGMVALDIHSGSVIWKNYHIRGLLYSTPAYTVQNDLIVCGAHDGFIRAFHAKTGSLAWSYKTNGEINEGGVFSADETFVIIGSMDGGLYVLNSSDGSLYHRFITKFGLHSIPAIQGSLIIIGGLDKYVYCFDISTRSVVWTFETLGRIFSSPTVSDTSVFIGSNDGRVYELMVHTGILISITQFSERITSRVSVDCQGDGRRLLYVVSHIGELYRMRECLS